METEKATKASVNYGPGHYPRGDYCGVCRFFVRRVRTCEKVQGTINERDWCELFERKK